jgi:hypothetical protein
MKNETIKTIVLFSLIFCLLNVISYSQSQSLNGKAVFFELQNPIEFKELDSVHHFQHDTIFHSRSGFLIRADFDTLTLNDKEYMVVTYPDFKQGKQNSGPGNYTAPVLLAGQSLPPPIHFRIDSFSKKTLAIPTEVFAKLQKDTLYSRGLKNIRLVAGQLTVPFKLRPSVNDTTNLSITTDVTIGFYLGLRQRISKREDYFVSPVFTLGLSFININDNTTSTSAGGEMGAGVYPGITWSSGLIFQLGQVNAGFVLGQDRASGIGDGWIYNGRMWYSFAIGYSFFK